MIIGIAVGGAVVLCAAGILTFCFCSRRRRLRDGLREPLTGPEGSVAATSDHHANEKAELLARVAEVEQQEAEAVARKDFQAAEALNCQAGELRKQIGQLENSAEGGRTATDNADEKAKLLAQLIELERQESEAVANKDYQAATAHASQAEELRKQMDSL